MRMEMEHGKLFIGGISWDTNEERLREYFEAFGEVVEAVIMKDRATGRARGFGFVRLSDPAAAERVLMEKHTIDGRTVEAKRAVPRDDQNIMNRNNSSIHSSPGPTRTKKIFVGGLASTVTENDFKNYFDKFGTVTDVVVMYDHNTRRPRGFGFITYDSEEAADKVLHKTFHDLNGKMVEVKRAVPKELSPGPSRSQLGGYNYGQSRVGSLFNGYTQGYNPSSIGGFGVRMDGRFSPITVGRNGLSPIGLGYGMGLNFEPGMSASHGGNANFSPNLSYGQELNPLYSVNSNKFNNSFAYCDRNIGSSSILNSKSRNILDNGNFNYAANTSNFNALAGSGSGNLGMDSFGSIGAIWGPSPRDVGPAYTSGSLGYGNGGISVGSGWGGVGRERNSGISAALAPSYAGYDKAYADFHESGSLSGDTTWRPSPPDLEESGSFGFGIGNAATDIITKNSGGFVGAYGVTNRQSNRGIVA